MGNKLSYRLALDLGSTSLGWALIRLKDGAPFAIIKTGVRIFSDGRHPRKGTSSAVERRLARGLRRRRDRLLKRKNRLITALIEFGFFPKDIEDRRALVHLDPYALRMKGLSEKLLPEEFARALFHLNQRRGFKSNRKANSKDDGSGALKQSISGIAAQLNEAGEDGKARTVGELLWHRKNDPAIKTVRARLRETTITKENGKNSKLKSYDLYIDRSMIADEFDALWSVQERFSSNVFTEEAKQKLRDCLLYQRPLRPVKVGKCTLLPDEKRCYLALPSQQLFRIYQEVNNLRLLDSELKGQMLTLTQRDIIVNELNKKSKVTFTRIKKLLGLSGSVQFNLENERRKELKGNTTDAELAKKDMFGPAWLDIPPALKDKIVTKIIEEESEEKLITYLKENTSATEEQINNILNAKLSDGVGSLSLAAINRILPYLQAGVITYDKAVRAAGFDSHSELYTFDVEIPGRTFKQEHIITSAGEIKTYHVFKELPYYGEVLQRRVAFGTDKQEDTPEKRFGKIANPTVHIGLNQVRVVVNDIIKRYGHPSEVIMEVARNLKQSAGQRKKEKEKQTDNQARNERLRELAAPVLQKTAENVTRAELQKLILWEELAANPVDRRCPYSGEQISLEQLLSEAIEIEHILPFGQTLDDSLNNKTVSTRSANRIKKDRAPWDARECFEAQGWKYEDILNRVAMTKREKRARFAENALKDWLEDNNDFLARALNDTRHLSIVATEYLQHICPANTRVIPGQLTALLRDKLGLNLVLGDTGEKNRNDHRHHAVDACVIGVTDRALLQRFATANARNKEEGSNRLIRNFDPPWPTYRQQVEESIKHIVVSHKPDHGYQAAFLEDKAYGPPRKGSRSSDWHNHTKGSEVKFRKGDRLYQINPRTSAAYRCHQDKSGNILPYKGYVGGSNYCIEIVVNEAGKWEGEVISTFDAYQIARKAGEKRLRHATLSQSNKPLLMRLTQGDTLKMNGKQGVAIFRVVKIDKSNKRVCSAEHNEANVDARNDKNKADPFVYKLSSAAQLQKAKAQRVTVSPAGQVTVHRIYAPSIKAEVAADAEPSC